MACVGAALNPASSIFLIRSRIRNPDPHISEKSVPDLDLLRGEKQDPGDANPQNGSNTPPHSYHLYVSQLITIHTYTVPWLRTVNFSLRLNDFDDKIQNYREEKLLITEMKTRNVEQNNNCNGSFWSNPVYHILWRLCLCCPFCIFERNV
jgi:hypothetical protein